MEALAWRPQLEWNAANKLALYQVFLSWKVKYLTTGKRLQMSDQCKENVYFQADIFLQDKITSLKSN